MKIDRARQFIDALQGYDGLAKQYLEEIQYMRETAAGVGSPMGNTGPKASDPKDKIGIAVSALLDHEARIQEKLNIVVTMKEKMMDWLDAHLSVSDAGMIKTVHAYGKRMIDFNPEMSYSWARRKYATAYINLEAELQRNPFKTVEQK